MNALTGLPWFAPLVFAPFAGSLAGVMIKRLPAGDAVAVARSRCDACGRALSPVELLPIVSYLVLRGRCRSCGASIAPFHLLIEVAAIAVAVSAAMLERDPLLLWVDCIAGWTLLTLAWIDWRHMWLPDVLTLPLIAFSLAATALTTPTLLADNVVGAIVGFGVFAGVAVLYGLWRGHDGLGGGDAKLLAASGALVGWAALPDIVLLAALSAIIAIAVQRIFGHAIGRDTPIPFGPWLALATWIVRLHGPLLFGGIM